ncbi:hypothetical protein FE782_22650 [Paenibacillus antri]|uniref:Phosphotyrosine protein phosphatase I domain-containing protein n=1 Tax=Paenibacillus antri TaxID=2582848 RepID=A0A5R9G1X0_9BACL|nr:hypothetical protein [Paenibacillus antri]TLS49811.1 hypothetical protein FE782_22650 [Paenibacillus antri]
MNILFVCTDNFTRSVIAEFCMRDYLKRKSLNTINVASAGIRADSDISIYSDIHFIIMKGMGIDTSGFKRTMFDEDSFKTSDIIIGMSNLHVDYIKEKFGREIVLFNELVDGSQVSVQVGAPDHEEFQERMEELVDYINSSIPRIIEKIEEQ